jgi:membrane protein implicated in regulation of membrane protease activity
MRFLALAFLWLLLIAAVLAALIFGALIFFGEDGETRLGGGLLSGLALLVALGSRAAIRALRRARKAQAHAFGTVTRVAEPMNTEHASPSLNPRDYGLPE